MPVTALAEVRPPLWSLNIPESLAVPAVAGESQGDDLDHSCPAATYVPHPDILPKSGQQSSQRVTMAATMARRRLPTLPSRHHPGAARSRCGRVSLR